MGAEMPLNTLKPRSLIREMGRKINSPLGVEVKRALGATALP